VTDQMCLMYIKRIHHCQQPIRLRLYSLDCVTTRQSMARQIRCNDIVTVIGKFTHLLCPGQTALSCSMHENDIRLPVFMVTATGGRVDLCIANCKTHQLAPNRLAAFRPRSKSAMISLIFSRPTDNRTMSSDSPPAFMSSTEMCEWVVDAG